MKRRKGIVVRLSADAIPMASPSDACPACRLLGRAGIISQVVPFACCACGYLAERTARYPLPAPRETADARS